MEKNAEQLQSSLITIASELFRFQKVFEKAISKLNVDERSRYLSQYAWFSKRVLSAMEEANLKLLNVEGQEYNAGMAVTPLNIDDFNSEDQLYVLQMLEPIIMQNDDVFKPGTVILGRVEN